VGRFDGARDVTTTIQVQQREHFQRPASRTLSPLRRNSPHKPRHQQVGEYQTENQKYLQHPSTTILLGLYDLRRSFL
jgi:hypothetical protein